jgi:hypothetical protein
MKKDIMKTKKKGGVATRRQTQKQKQSSITDSSSFIRPLTDIPSELSALHSYFQSTYPHIQFMDPMRYDEEEIRELYKHFFSKDGACHNMLLPFDALGIQESEFSKTKIEIMKEDETYEEGFVNTLTANCFFAMNTPKTFLLVGRFDEGTIALDFICSTDKSIKVSEILNFINSLYDIEIESTLSAFSYWLNQGFHVTKKQDKSHDLNKYPNIYLNKFLTDEIIQTVDPDNPSLPKNGGGKHKQKETLLTIKPALIEFYKQKSVSNRPLSNRPLIAMYKDKSTVRVNVPPLPLDNPSSLPVVETTRPESPSPLSVRDVEESTVAVPRRNSNPPSQELSVPSSLPAVETTRPESPSPSSMRDGEESTVAVPRRNSNPPSQELFVPSSVPIVELNTFEPDYEYVLTFNKRNGMFRNSYAIHINPLTGNFRVFNRLTNEEIIRITSETIEQEIEEIQETEDEDYLNKYQSQLILVPEGRQFFDLTSDGRFVPRWQNPDQYVVMKKDGPRTLVVCISPITETIINIYELENGELLPVEVTPYLDMDLQGLPDVTNPIGLTTIEGKFVPLGRFQIYRQEDRFKYHYRKIRDIFFDDTINPLPADDTINPLPAIPERRRSTTSRSVNTPVPLLPVGANEETIDTFGFAKRKIEGFKSCKHFKGARDCNNSKHCLFTQRGQCRPRGYDVTDQRDPLSQKTIDRRTFQESRKLDYNCKTLAATECENEKDDTGQIPICKWSESRQQCRHHTYRLGPRKQYRVKESTPCALLTKGECERSEGKCKYIETSESGKPVNACRPAEYRKWYIYRHNEPHNKRVVEQNMEDIDGEGRDFFDSITTQTERRPRRDKLERFDDATGNVYNYIPNSRMFTTTR